MESTAAFDGAEVADDAERCVSAGIFDYDVGNGFGETKNLKKKKGRELIRRYRRAIAFVCGVLLWFRTA